MALSPEDIVNHAFGLAVRGYAKTEVDDLLDRLADQIERAERDVTDMQVRLRDAEARAAGALEIEDSLKRTLITAQDAAQRTVDEANVHAETVRRDADLAVAQQLQDVHERAATMIAAADEEVARIREQARVEQEAAVARIDALAVIEDRYREQLRGHLESQLAALDAREAAGPSGGAEVGDLRVARDAFREYDPDDAREQVPDDEGSPVQPPPAPGGLTVRVHDDPGDDPDDPGPEGALDRPVAAAEGDATTDDGADPDGNEVPDLWRAPADPGPSA